MNSFLFNVTDELDDKYDQRILPPMYAPRREKPRVHELIDKNKATELHREIERTEDIPDDVRSFLHSAANRHLKFDYAKIADYYCHAPEHIQELMENSALVIIDFEKAIQGGFVRLNDALKEAYRNDHPEED